MLSNTKTRCFYERFISAAYRNEKLDWLSSELEPSLSSLLRLMYEIKCHHRNNDCHEPLIQVFSRYDQITKNADEDDRHERFHSDQLGDLVRDRLLFFNVQYREPTKPISLFLEFAKEDKHFSKYYEGFYILFKTGLRISEFCGLTNSDIDMKKRIIHVRHQLLRTSEMKYVVEATKTNAGTRDIPMTEQVYHCFEKILEKRENEIIGPEIGGLKGFLYLDKNGRPMVALHWEKYFKHIIEKYNKKYKEELPRITPHICRHTYITNMVRAGMSLKQLQYLVGHSEISIG